MADGHTPRRRPVAASVEELLADCRPLGEHVPNERRSAARFDAVERDGQRCVVKYVHPDLDFTLRVTGDLAGRPLRIWETGVVDLAADTIDHAILGAAPWGRNGWGAALLMRDVSSELVPSDDSRLSEERHAAFLDAIAALTAAAGEWHDADGVLLSHAQRLGLFSPPMLEGERSLGWPELVPRLADEGWRRFADLVPPRLGDAVQALHRDPTPLCDALAATPRTLVHGDWKIGNLGTAPDGRTVLLDWTYTGEGPVTHELAWYLALNNARLPQGHGYERVADDLRAALERRGVDTSAWWERQVSLSLLGAVLQFGWEKSLGADDPVRSDLGWWVDAATGALDLL